MNIVIGIVGALIGGFLRRLPRSSTRCWTCRGSRVVHAVHRDCLGVGDPAVRSSAAAQRSASDVPPVSASGTMSAWRVRHPGPMSTGPLEHVTAPLPEPAPTSSSSGCSPAGSAEPTCTWRRATCRPPGGSRARARGGRPGGGGREDGLRGFRGERVGVAWLRRTCGECRFCRRGAREPLPAVALHRLGRRRRLRRYTTVPADYAHRLPEGYTDAELAPLLCAGIIGHHARRAELPAGGRLGVYGFGGSAHSPPGRAGQGVEVHVMTRPPPARELALASRRRVGAGRGRPTPGAARRVRSSSRRSGTWCRGRSRPSTAAGHWPSPASTSPRSRRWTTSATCSRNARCAASPRTPGPTPARSCASPGSHHLEVSTVPLPPRARRRCPGRPRRRPHHGGRGPDGRLVTGSPAHRATPQSACPGRTRYSGPLPSDRRIRSRAMPAGAHQKRLGRGGRGRPRRPRRSGARRRRPPARATWKGSVAESASCTTSLSVRASWSRSRAETSRAAMPFQGTAGQRAEPVFDLLVVACPRTRRARNRFGHDAGTAGLGVACGFERHGADVVGLDVVTTSRPPRFVTYVNAIPVTHD